MEWEFMKVVKAGDIDYEKMGNEARYGNAHDHDDEDEEDDENNDLYGSDQREICICTTEIKYLFYIRNKENGIVTFVGSNCITRFFKNNTLLIAETEEAEKELMKEVRKK